MITHRLFSARGLSRALNPLLALYTLSTLSALLCAQQASAERFQVKSTSLRLTPQLSLSATYDNNVFYEANPEPTGSVPNDGLMFKLGGALELDNRHKSSVDVALNTSLAYRYYAYMDDEGGRVSDQAQASRNTLDFIKLNGHVLFGTQTPLKLKLKENLTYIERPAYENNIYGFERYDNRVGAMGLFAPGKGAEGGPLSLGVGYELQKIGFLNERDGLLIQGRSSKLAHTMVVESKWRFLPKNYLMLDIRYSANNYNPFSPQDETQSANDPSLSRDSTPLRAQLGLSGLITSRLSLFMKGGYANTYHENGESFSGLIALFEVSYRYEPRFRFSVGYQRDAQDSGFSNFYTLNRAFLKGRLSLSERVSLSTKLSYDLYDYTASKAIGDQGRTDPVTRALITLSFPMSKHLVGQLSWSYEGNATTYTLPVDTPVKTDFAQYQRQLINLSVLFN